MFCKSESEFRITLVKILSRRGDNCQMEGVVSWKCSRGNFQKDGVVRGWLLSHGISGNCQIPVEGVATAKLKVW